MDQEDGVPSRAELGRRADEILKRFEHLTNRLETTYVRYDLFEAAKQLAAADRDALSARLAKLESRSEWIVRTIGAILIGAVIGGVLAGGKALSGGG